MKSLMVRPNLKRDWSHSISFKTDQPSWVLMKCIVMW